MAKQFKFRLDTMLKIRQQREDEHKRIVSDRVQQIARVHGDVERVQSQIEQQANAIRSNQGGGAIDMQQVIRHRHWLGHLHRMLLELQSRERFLEGRLAQERLALAEAVKQRKILSKLKERQYRKFMDEQERVEVAAADDLTTVRLVYENGETSKRRNVEIET